MDHASKANFGIISREKLCSNSITREAGKRITEWWVENVHLTKERTLLSTSPKMITIPDTYLEKEGESFIKGGKWEADSTGKEGLMFWN